LWALSETSQLLLFRAARQRCQCPVLKQSTHVEPIRLKLPRIYLRRNKTVILVNLALVGLLAQTAKPPVAYSVTQTNSMFGPATSMVVYRDGSKALVDQRRTEGSHTRTLYDLAAGKSSSWDADSDSGGCSAGTFSGDWGDPFASSGEMAGELAKQHAKEVGAETIGGIATKVWEVASPQGNSKVWIDGKYGLLMKWEMTPPGGPAKIVTEVKQVSLTAPAASLFALPASCVAAASAPTEADRIASETGASAADFVNAIMAPPTPSTTSCTVAVRVMQAGSMAPVTSGFKWKAPAGEFRNGVLRISNAPVDFNMDGEFGNGGAFAMIHRQCFGPETTLLFVVKDPNKVGEGGYWLWAKTAKFAAPR
jgi:hypothetical protein